MFKVIGLQIVVTVVVALLAGWIGGAASAISALLGGAACFVPNALFAARIFLATRKRGGGGATTFFVGEFVKLGLTVALLVTIAQGYDELVWPALIVAIIACLKSYLLVFWFDTLQHNT